MRLKIWREKDMAFEIDTHDDEFVMDDDFEDQTKIMVIGVGGGGGNAVSHMVEGDMTGIVFVFVFFFFLVLFFFARRSAPKTEAECAVSRSARSAPEVRALAITLLLVRIPRRRTATISRT